ncbi:MAG TPA: helix-turn-helix transcriptional regulator, partial [Planctomycetota bacterium]|nr:helix-turn-helix transcriptional regulator [Planctomycetota bacterium]
QASRERLATSIRLAVERKRSAAARPPDGRFGALARELLERVPTGVMFLDDAGRLVWANPAAKEIVLREAYLRIAADGTALGAAPDGSWAPLAPWLLRGARSGEAAHEILALSARRDHRPLPAVVLATAATARGERRAPVAILLVSDLDHLPTPSEEALRCVFHLTPAQARLGALIAQGLAPKEAARSLGVSWNTVRAHLRSLFSKTGTSGQGELGRVLGASIFRLRIRWEGAP